MLCALCIFSPLVSAAVPPPAALTFSQNAQLFSYLRNRVVIIFRFHGIVKPDYTQLRMFYVLHKNIFLFLWIFDNTQKDPFQTGKGSFHFFTHTSPSPPVTVFDYDSDSDLDSDWIGLRGHMHAIAFNGLQLHASFQVFPFSR